MQQEAKDRYYREMQENRQPTQTELNGIIHIETNHPRSSIIIIRADDIEDNKKKPLNEINRLTNSEQSIRDSTIDENAENTTLNEEIKFLTHDDVKINNDLLTIDEKYREVQNESRTDDTNSESDKSFDVYDKENSCLKQLYPEPYDQFYDKLRLYEKLAEVFIVCLGVRQNVRLGPTGFRTFSRLVYIDQLIHTYRKNPKKI